MSTLYFGIGLLNISIRKGCTNFFIMRVCAVFFVLGRIGKNRQKEQQKVAYLVAFAYNRIDRFYLGRIGREGLIHESGETLQLCF